MPLLPPALSSTHDAAHHPCPSFRLPIQAHIMQYIIVAPPSAGAFKHTSCSTSSMPLFPPALSSTHHAVHHPCPSFRLRIQAHIMQHIVLAPASACALKHTSCSTCQFDLTSCSTSFRLILPPANLTSHHAAHHLGLSFLLLIQTLIMQHIICAAHDDVCTSKHKSCST